MAAKPLVLHQADNLVALGSSEESAIRAVLPRQEIDLRRPYEKGGAGRGERDVPPGALRRARARRARRRPRKTARIDGDSAVTDVADLSPRLINLELRCPSTARTSATSPSRTRGEALGGRGLAGPGAGSPMTAAPAICLHPLGDGPEIHDRPGRVVARGEHDVRRRGRRQERGLADRSPPRW
ncbi:hypothetical protein HBB16_08985 [Pseudonocardia sp. MCCB 268]|nr:hypothetical protein [Pseudonocardia cytotoxica]